MLFSTVVVPMYIHTNSVGGSPFFHTLSSIAIYRLFNDGHSYQCEVIPHLVLICISLIITNVEHLFMCVLAICMSCLKKWLPRSLTIFGLGCLFFQYCVSWIVWTFWWLIPYQSHQLQIFSPILWVVFSFCFSFLCCAKVFQFH